MSGQTAHGPWSGPYQFGGQTHPSLVDSSDEGHTVVNVTGDGGSPSALPEASGNVGASNVIVYVVPSSHAPDSVGGATVASSKKGDHVRGGVANVVVSLVSCVTPVTTIDGGRLPVVTIGSENVMVSGVSTSTLSVAVVGEVAVMVGAMVSTVVKRMMTGAGIGDAWTSVALVIVRTYVVSGKSSTVGARESVRLSSDHDAMKGVRGENVAAATVVTGSRTFENVSETAGMSSGTNEADEVGVDEMRAKSTGSVVNSCVYDVPNVVVGDDAAAMSGPRLMAYVDASSHGWVGVNVATREATVNASDPATGVVSGGRVTENEAASDVRLTSVSKNSATGAVSGVGVASVFEGDKWRRSGETKKENE